MKHAATVCTAIVLCLAIRAAHAQPAFTVGVAYKRDATSALPDAAPLSAPLISAPLISSPRWWPRRITHQNLAVLTVAGAVGITFLWLLPEELSDWDKSIPLGRNVKNSFTRPPIWDDDPYYWNYIIHPVTGSYVYLMERNHGRSATRGFLLSTAASIGWEYGFETIMQQPSIQDLLVTSTVGSLLGEVSHRATLAMKKNGFSIPESVLLTVINPHYVVSNGYK